MLKIFLLVIVGLAGNPENGATFNKWGAALAGGAAKLGVEKTNLIYLGEPSEGAEITPDGRATKEQIEQAFQKVAKAASPDDAVYVVLIGHGTYDGRSAKFNMPGPDLSAEEFGVLLKTVKARQVVFADTTSSSGPFIEALSGPGRTIITATRNGAEQYATLFGGYFVDALTGDEADADKNRRVTMLEAFRYAKAEVAKAYEREGLLATEHALLDDNGDKQGSPDPTPTAADGKIASALSLGSSADGVLPADPKLRALYLERRDLERRVESLRLLKDSMEPAKYSTELERLVTELALKTREIRAVEGAK